MARYYFETFRFKPNTTESNTMKLPELTYFFDAYNLPSLRYLYPTNDDLWRTFNSQEGKAVKSAMLDEITWVLNSNELEQKQVMTYLNQVGSMGVIRFKKTAKMVSFLTEMQDNMVLS